jgi:hypothetical protein
MYYNTGKFAVKDNVITRTLCLIITEANNLKY